jgi:glucan-binding YG repeat protein
MKKLLTTIFISILVLACIFAQPARTQAAAENAIMNNVQTTNSGDIDVPFEPIKKVRRIWVSTKPSKVVYYAGENLDITGMVVKATYSDGNSVEVTNYTVSGYSASTIGEQTITVTFSGKTATFIVTVVALDYTYTIENGGAIITGYTGTGGDILIPATLGGYPVTTIGECAFYGCSSLTGVTIPDSVTTIDCQAFFNCSSLSQMIYSGTKCQWNKITIRYGIDEQPYSNWVFSKGEHSFTYYLSDNNATCTADGTKTANCNHCDATDIAVDTDTKLGHSFTNYVSNNDATYDADGTKTAKCDRCEVIDTVTDPGTMKARNGWFSEGGKWYYYKSNVKVTGWLKDAGTWYYLNNSGVMLTNWQVIGGKWYYFTSSGAMVTGWRSIGGVYYYFNTSGAMATGWLKQGNTWYYLQSSGAMATGWQKVGSTWYYFQSSGAMKTGWLKLGSTWYYFHSSGAMATGSVRIGTKTYKFNASGACLNP